MHWYIYLCRCLLLISSKNKRLHQIYGFGPKSKARTLLPNFDGIPVGHLRSHAPGLGDRCLSAGFMGNGRRASPFPPEPSGFFEFLMMDFCFVIRKNDSQGDVFGWGFLVGYWVDSRAVFSAVCTNSCWRERQYGLSRMSSPARKIRLIRKKNTFSRTFQPVTHLRSTWKKIKKWIAVPSECTGYTRLSNVKI